MSLAFGSDLLGVQAVLLLDLEDAGVVPRAGSGIQRSQIVCGPRNIPWIPRINRGATAGRHLEVPWVLI